MKDYEFWKNNRKRKCYASNSGLSRTFATLDELLTLRKFGAFFIRKGTENNLYATQKRLPNIEHFDFESFKYNVTWDFADGALGAEQPFNIAERTDSKLSDCEKDLFCMMVGKLIGEKTFATEEEIEITDWFFDQLKGENK